MVANSDYRKFISNLDRMVKGINVQKKKRIGVLRPLRKDMGLQDMVYNRVAMAPVAQNKSAGQTRGGSLRFKECERITTINGSVAFAVTGSIACNPGISSSFPWLSGHANLFERYRIHKLVFRYKNLKGTASNGNILMSFDYDTLDNPPATAVEMTQSTVYVDGAPWRIFELDVPSDRRDLFTRSGAVANSDLKTYDMGKLHIAAEGCADTTPHGYLEVEYDVELFMKQSITSGTSSTGFGTVSVDATGALTNNTIGATNVGAVVSAPAGTYYITLSGVGTGGAFVPSTFNTATINAGLASVAVSDTVIVTLASAGVLGTIVAGSQTSVVASVLKVA